MKLTCILIALMLLFLFSLGMKKHAPKFICASILSLTCGFFIPYDFQLTEAVFLLPALRFNHPELFANDYIIHSGGFSGYTLLSWLISLPPESWLSPVMYIGWLVCLGLFGGLNFLILKYLLKVGKSSLLFSFLISLLICITYRNQAAFGVGTLGDITWFYPFFRHQTVSMLFFLAATWNWFRSRTVWAAIFSAAALNFHINIGLYALMLFTLDGLFSRFPKNEVGRFMGLTILFSLPTIIPVALGELGLSQSERIPHPFVYVSGYFRHPHHLIYSSFPLAEYIGHIALITTFILLYLLSSKRSRLLRRMFRLILFICLLQGVGWFFVEVVPNDFIAKLQFSRMTLISQLLSLLGIASILANRLPSVRIECLRRDTIKVALVIFLLAGFAIFNSHELMDRPPNAMEKWFVDNTDPNALILISPVNFNYAKFEVYTRRATVVNAKRLPFSGRQVEIYIRRIQDILGLEPQITQSSMRHLHDRILENNIAFNHLSEPHLEWLHDRYPYEYIVRHVQFDDQILSCPVVYQDAIFRVYQYASNPYTAPDEPIKVE